MKRGFWIWIVNNFVSTILLTSVLGVLALMLAPGVTNHRRNHTLPIFAWTCFAVAITSLVAGILAHVRLRRLETREAAGLCPACGYDLRASKDRCPECGSPIALAKSPEGDER